MSVQVPFVEKSTQIAKALPLRAGEDAGSWVCALLAIR
jgi:hypothetical protein